MRQSGQKILHLNPCTNKYEQIRHCWIKNWIPRHPTETFCAGYQHCWRHFWGWLLHFTHNTTMIDKYYLYLFLPLWVLLWPDVTSANDLPFLVQANFINMSPPFMQNLGDPWLQRSEKGSPLTVLLTRKSVYQIFREYGPHSVKIAYCAYGWELILQTL